MSTPSVRVEFGHVLDVLQGMPEQSVQLIATSPPYFGLRDYGLEPVVWERILSAKAAVGSAKKPRRFAPSRAPHVQLDMFEDAYV